MAGIHKPVLIIGGTGFVGRHLVRKLMKRKMNFVCMVRKTKALKGCRTVRGDVTDKKSLLKAMKGMGVVVNLAASISSDWKPNYEINIFGMMNVVEACKQMKINKMIAISSVDANFKNSSNYGKTKLAGQVFVERSGLDYIVLVPSLIYGKDSPGLNSIIKMIKKTPIIPIFTEAMMQPVYVEDVCDAIISAINSPLKRKTYNIAGSQALIFEESLKLIENTLSIEKKHIHVPLRIMKPLLSRFGISERELSSIINDKNMDISSARKDLDFNPISFEDGLKLLYGGKP